jgi:hypothetical protein
VLLLLFYLGYPTINTLYLNLLDAKPEDFVGSQNTLAKSLGLPFTLTGVGYLSRCWLR